MQWLRKCKPPPDNQETRIIRRFLFWPRTINNETRWLKFAKIEQEYMGRKRAYKYGVYYIAPPFWEDRHWL